MDEQLDDRFADATAAERDALLDTEIVLDELSKQTVHKIVESCLVFCDELSGHPLYNYERPLAYRILESLIINDGATISALFCRQSGKTETVADTVATAMILFPRLAKIYPLLMDKFKEGVWVGAFGPTDLMADTIHGRIVARLASDKASAMLADPEINDRLIRVHRGVALKNCGSCVIKNTAHPRAKIEGQTFHIILLDEAQDADNRAVDKSVVPMGTATNATKVYSGTPTYTKNVFYREIQNNKRAALRRGARQDHFEVPWQVAAKENKNYRIAVKKAMLSMGEDSDEFRLSYKIEWLLDKGQFASAGKLEELGDRKMPYVVHEWYQTPVVVGIDCGRIKDRTIVTVVFVDWNNPDAAGFLHHRVLKWLDLEGLAWEDQYFRIQEFLSHYNVWKVGVDSGGLGDTVIDRLRNLMPHIHFEPMGDSTGDQSIRWKYLKQLMDRYQITWPAGAKVQALRTWRRFIQEMGDLQIEFKGPNMMAFAPNEANAHDDYCDSLAMACILSTSLGEDQDNSMIIYDNLFYG